MKLTLHNLAVSHGATKKRKRVGRGNASGHGTFSTRGQKGQRSRSGTGGLKRIGMRSMLLATPKFKGQKIRFPKKAVVNVELLEKHFAAGDTVDARALLRKGLISTERNGLKILGVGALSKPLTVIAQAFSQTAQAAISKAGGKVIVKN